ncbi:carboxymuconolactone decarboxylase family protein [soil metagenome]
MKKRIVIKDLEPNAYKAMLELENYAKTTQIPSSLRQLIKIRASQINGCAYCLDMHTEHALEEGESDRRIFAVAVWKESHLFTDAERAVLQLTEEVTSIALHGVEDETYENAIKFYGEKGVAQLIMQIVVINSWNRIAVSTKMIYK